MNGRKNLWILKPGNSSRGRGIKIYNNLKDIKSKYENNKIGIDSWVVMKYIENPLIL